jgi:hypothetical protein
MKITTQWLKEKSACHDGLLWFKRQLDRTELMAEWNRVMRKRTANKGVTVGAGGDVP